ncbi:hypothetical protein FQN50_008097 [Emmonsiellopsis sp. PD_5]|nr:hypothetical protein FQN50_008097 [Emmonsiellopsis sp. PD_5]
MTAIDIMNTQDTPYLTEFLIAEVSSLALAIEALSLNDTGVHATEISGTEQSCLYRTTTVQSITMVDADQLYEVDTTQVVEMMEIDGPVVVASEPAQTQYKRRKASHQPRPQHQQQPKPQPQPKPKPQFQPQHQPQLYRPRQNGRHQPPVDNHHRHHNSYANYTPVQRDGQQPSAPQADRQRLPRGNRPHPPPPRPHHHHRQKGTKPCTTLPTPVVLVLLVSLSQCLLFIRKVLANKISGYQLPQTITTTTTTWMSIWKSSIRNRDRRRPESEIGTGTGIETGAAESVNGSNNHQKKTTEFIEGGDERERPAPPGSRI